MTLKKGTQDTDNVLELMDFFNSVADLPLFNDKFSFLLYLAFCCGSNMKTVYALISQGCFEVVPGMLMGSLRKRGSMSWDKVLTPMFTRQVE